MYSAKCEDGTYTVYRDGEVIKVLPNAFKFEQFMTVLWENQEISREDIIDLMNPLMGYHPIREFDSRPKLGTSWKMAKSGNKPGTDLKVVTATGQFMPMAMMPNVTGRQSKIVRPGT
ncbi:hypothetical protein emiel_11 [Salmonella phage emiel]|uniref:Uncharacterized protein n=1 Tax=Salmonella phage emiel TaxID=2713295 RepID=A0A6G8RAM8_9CAUD|nr:hypothetical protein emiel_11 [Salmonella phage emiel]